MCLVEDQSRNLSCNSASRYLDGLLNIDNLYFEGMVSKLYPVELQLNKANISYTEAPFFIYIYQFQTDLFHIKSLTTGMIFCLYIVIFPYLDSDVPRTTSYGVYSSQLIRVARLSSHFC